MDYELKETIALISLFSIAIIIIGGVWILCEA